MNASALRRALQLRAVAYLPREPLASPEGPLGDLEFTVKDLFAVPGWPLRAGTEAPLPALGSSAAVGTLRELGARLLAKTQLHEVALGITGQNPLIGATRNPLDPRRVSGGSSSGAAVAARVGFGDFALGTDTGGSVRIPAALCGVWGFKPSFGRYSTEGLLPLSPSCDHVGVLTAEPALLPRVDRVLGGEGAGAAWKPQRIGLTGEEWCSEAVWESCCGAAGALGARVTRYPTPDLLGTYRRVSGFEAARVHRAALEREHPGFSPATLALLRAGAEIPEADYRAALEEREAARARLLTAMDHLEIDLLAAPAVPVPAPFVGQQEVAVRGQQVGLRTAFLRLTAPYSLLGLPVLLQPLPLGALSCGLQWGARPGQDAALLALAERLSACAS